jgi:hypothetical protein
MIIMIGYGRRRWNHGDRPLKKIAAKRASEIVPRSKLSADAQKLVNDPLSPDATSTC